MRFFSSCDLLLCHRPGRAAVLIDDHRRDPLRHEIEGRAAQRVAVAKAACRARAIIRVRVNVDEAGRKILPVRIDHASGLLGPQRANRDDAAVANADVCGKPGIARAIEHLRVANEEVERLTRLRAVNRGGKQSAKHSCRREKEFHERDSTQGTRLASLVGLGAARLVGLAPSALVRRPAVRPAFSPGK